MNSVLSQEEINALLNETFAKNPSEKEEDPKQILTPLEVDTLGEISNISMGSAATALSSLLGKRVDITTPNVEVTTLTEVRSKYTKPYVVVDVNYNKGLVGTNTLIIQTYDAGVIVDLMMGGDGSNPSMELNDLHLSAVGEAMNQMMGASSTSLSQVLSMRIDISPPMLDLYELQEYDFHLGDDDKVVKMSFHVVIKDLIDSEMMQLIPISFAKNLVDELMKNNGISETQPTIAPPIVTYQEERTAPRRQDISNEAENRHSFNEGKNQQQVEVTPVEYPKFSQGNAHSIGQTNLDLILDVGLQLSVELGRTNKKIKDILELSNGSIIELDKLAGEPVDILVNGKLLAKGEVVVIDENFGVRVTEIVSPLERVRSLK
ncbi:MAG: flagellar motor switch phosphatase FliY [Firmicutes bacterium HGW-Firmicutes-12]|nr:MAG: flagellar motor switch phosphatase FliY [Firmicutes bacterium HGW-Firmicutes-12]